MAKKKVFKDKKLGELLALSIKTARAEASALKKVLASVKKGAKFLDKEMPGWHKYVKVKKLDISSNDNCIMGQLAPKGNCWEYADELLGRKNPENYGFFGDSIFKEEQLEAWKQEIAIRLNPPTKKKSAKKLAKKAVKKVKKNDRLSSSRRQPRSSRRHTPR